MSKKNQDQAIAASRTLFIRNVQFDTKEQEILDKFEPFGDIKTVFNLVAKRGLIFITYNDLRAAESAMNALGTVEFNGRKADVHFSVPKEGDMPEKAQASVEVELESGQPLVTHTLFEFMSKFGEIRSIRDSERQEVKTVSYWDTRAAMRALDGLEENGSFADSKLRAKLSWDDGFEKFASSAGLTNTNSRPQRDRDTNRGRGDKDRNRNYNRRDRSRSPGRDRDRQNNRDRDRDRDYDRNRDSRSDYSSNFRIPPAGRQCFIQGPPMNLMDYLSNNRQQPMQQQQPPYFQPPPMPYGQAPQTAQPNPLAALLGPGQPQPAQVQQLMNLLTQMGAVPNPAYQPIPPNQGIPQQGYYAQQQQQVPQQMPGQQQAPLLPQQQQQIPQSYPPQQFSIQPQQQDPRLQQQPPADPRFKSQTMPSSKPSLDPRSNDSSKSPSTSNPPISGNASASTTGTPTQLQALAALLMQSQKPT